MNYAILSKQHARWKGRRYVLGSREYYKENNSLAVIRGQGLPLDKQHVESDLPNGCGVYYRVGKLGAMPYRSILFLMPAGG